MELVRTKLAWMELMARVKVRQLKELEVFDSLRLSIVVVAAEVLAKILTAEVLIKLTSGTELI